MAKGYPDWGVVKNSVGVFSDDNAELAVRLGSNYRISRTGRVLLASNFISDFGIWSVAYLHANVTKIYLLDGVFHPGCVRVAAAIGDTLTWTISRQLPLIASNIYGYEVIVKDKSANTMDVTLKMSVTRATEVANFELLFKTNAGELWYRDPTNTLVKLIDLTQDTSISTIWTTIKMLVDIVNNQIMVVQINGTNVITNPLDVFIDTGAFSALNVGVSIKAAPRVAVDIDFRVASAIITYDEDNI